MLILSDTRSSDDSHWVRLGRLKSGTVKDIPDRGQLSIQSIFQHTANSNLDRGHLHPRYNAGRVRHKTVKPGSTNTLRQSSQVGSPRVERGGWWHHVADLVATRTTKSVRGDQARTGQREQLW